MSRAAARLTGAGRLAVALAVALAAAWGAARPAAAHEVPARVAVRAFVKPEPGRLRVLVRAPLEAMRDVDVPLRADGSLDVARATPALAEAARVWIADGLDPREDGRRLGRGRVVAARASLPSDRAFADYAAALAHVAGGAPIAADVALPWRQAMLDVLVEYPIASERGEFSLRPALAHLGVKTTTVLHFLPPGGASRAFEYEGDPGLVRLDPRWYQAALPFVRLGFLHILDGADHLLFVLCLVIPFRRARPLVGMVTAFTVGHSITLGASALGLAPTALWFPPLVETLIAASIVWMALENVLGARAERRWVFAFGFGLVHGFGFSFALRDSLQFAGSHLATALAAFNVGVELGQLAALAVAVPALALLFRFGVAERAGTIVLSALVAHTAWHWTGERAAELGQYRVTWPAPDAALLAGVLQAAFLATVAGGVAWALSGAMARLTSPAPARAGAEARTGARPMAEGAA